MSIAPSFLHVDQILAISSRVGGQFPLVRNRGLLEIAAALPRSTFAGEWLHGSVAVIAAAYFFHLCKQRPFVHGNRRTALATAEVFLDLNGMKLRAGDVEVERLARSIAANQVSKSGVATFFLEHVGPIEKD